MKIKELKKYLTDKRISDIVSLKLKIRDFRCLKSDAMRCKHHLSKDAIYSRAATIMTDIFHGQSLLPGIDVLRWRQTKENKMFFHPTPNLKGI